MAPRAGLMAAGLVQTGSAGKKKKPAAAAVGRNTMHTSQVRDDITKGNL
jgi:hypothetical protein